MLITSNSPVFWLPTIKKYLLLQQQQLNQNSYLITNLELFKDHGLRNLLSRHYPQDGCNSILHFGRIYWNNSQNGRQCTSGVRIFFCSFSSCKYANWCNFQALPLPNLINRSWRHRKVSDFLFLLLYIISLAFKIELEQVRNVKTMKLGTQ